MSKQWEHKKVKENEEDNESIKSDGNEDDD